jgi:hypothetical protein
MRREVRQLLFEWRDSCPELADQGEEDIEWTYEPVTSSITKKTRRVLQLCQKGSLAMIGRGLAAVVLQILNKQV